MHLRQVRAQWVLFHQQTGTCLLLQKLVDCGPLPPAHRLRPWGARPRVVKRQPQQLPVHHLRAPHHHSISVRRSPPPRTSDTASPPDETTSRLVDASSSARADAPTAGRECCSAPADLLQAPQSCSGSPRCPAAPLPAPPPASLVQPPGIGPTPTPRPTQTGLDTQAHDSNREAPRWAQVDRPYRAEQRRTLGSCSRLKVTSRRSCTYCRYSVRVGCRTAAASACAFTQTSQK